MEIVQEKNCGYCGKSIRGRTDKKFCNDYCRNYYNHQRKSKEGGWEKDINQILALNRRILHSLAIPQKFMRIDKDSLLSMGFDRRYCTEILQLKSRVFCFACYDYAYFFLEKDGVVVFERSNIRRLASTLPDDREVV